MATIECAGTVQTDAIGNAQCVDGGGMPLEWTTVPQFDPSMVEPTTFGAAFGAGFIVVAAPMILILAGKLVLRAIKQA